MMPAGRSCAQLCTLCMIGTRPVSAAVHAAGGRGTDVSVMRGYIDG